MDKLTSNDRLQIINSCKDKSRPKVGIYWVIKELQTKKNIILEKSIFLPDPSSILVDFFDVDFGHYDVWDDLKQKYYWLYSDDCYDWPRDRILWVKSSSFFRVFIDYYFFKHKYYETIILDTFNIPKDCFEFETDEHYSKSKYAYLFAKKSL
jgi:hypothetical protein